MNSLIEQLAEYEANHVLWHTPEFGEIKVAGLVAALEHFETGNWRGKRVAIGNLPVLEFVASLVFLDGLAEVILLLPKEETPEASSSRLAQARIDTVLEHNGLGISALIPRSEVAKRSGPEAVITGKRQLNTTWLLPTSGTSGTPQLIPHTLSSLTRSMTFRRTSKDYVWGSLYSLRRFAGLQVFLQSWIAGCPLILFEEENQLAEMIAGLVRSGCNALSATPSMWRKLMMHPMVDQLAFKQITLGGEIVDQAILNVLTARFPEARITHIYASTEAGVGFAVRDQLSGFPVDYLDNPPLGRHMRVDENGHLWFRSAPSSSLALSDDGDWIDSGDVVRIVGLRVHFVGRANGSINVGGNKVMPEEVEAVIKELPEIAFVHVRARKNTIMGNLVEAAVSVVPGTVVDVALKKRITTHCLSRLEAFKVPAFIVESADIVLSPSGKLSRV